MMNAIIAFGMPGPSEWIVILILALLLFGAKRLPELARGLGKSIKEFKRATSEVEDNIREAMKEEEKPPMPSPEQPKDSADKDSQK